MTTIETPVDPALKAASFLDRARAISPLIAEEANDTEREGHVTQKAIDAILETELHQVMIPTELRGGGRSYTEALQVIEEISNADGSTGWALNVGISSTATAAGYMPSEGQADMFLGDEPGIVAGQLLPRLPATQLDGGYVINGDFQFASGSDMATWMGAGFFVADENGDLIKGEDGKPIGKIGFFPRGNVEFLGGWNVWGMVGTGSYDYRVRNLFVPEKHTHPMLGAPTRPEAFYKLGVLFLGVGGHCAIVLGIARRALEEVTAIVEAKGRPGYDGPIGDAAIFRVDFARNEALLQAARLYLFDLVRQGEQIVNDGGVPSPELQARMRQATTWIHEVTYDIVSFATYWGGTQSIRTNNALGRCYRDVTVARNHLLMDRNELVKAAGEILPAYRAGSPR